MARPIGGDRNWTPAGASDSPDSRILPASPPPAVEGIAPLSRNTW